MKPDIQIKERPKCQNKDCKNKALMLVGDKMFCGQCIEKIKTKIQKMVTEIAD